MNGIYRLLVIGQALWFVASFIARAIQGVFITNFSFPTKTEQVLWRSACVYFLVFALVSGTYTWIWHLAIFDKYKTTSLPISEKASRNSQGCNGIKYRIKVLATKVRKVSADEDPSFIMPFSLIGPVTLFCIFYCLFRLYILIEDLIGSRYLPSSAYSSVNWSEYIPHL